MNQQQTKERKNKNLRDNLKLFLLKSENGSDKVKVDKTVGISFKALRYLEISAGNTMSEKVQNKDVRFVRLIRKVSDRAKEDLKDLEEMINN